MFYDAIWNPKNIKGRLLWFLDRGSLPRSENDLGVLLKKLFIHKKKFQSPPRVHYFMVRKSLARVTPAKSKKPFGKKVCLSDYTNGLKKRQDGIWYASKTDKVSYPRKGNEQCFGIEDKSFWFQHRNACVIQIIKGESGNFLKI